MMEQEEEEEEEYGWENEDEGVPIIPGDEPEIPPIKYEYLDHTADVQLHSSGGDNLKESFEQVAMAMFGYMTTNYDSVEMKTVHDVEANGEDLLSLLFHFLDEFLFLFSAEPCIIPRVVKITEFDTDNFHIKAKGYGEPFEIGKHPQGTEVKAITYSAMQVMEKKETHDIFVVIDI